MPDISDPHYAVMRTTRIVSWSHALWVGRHNSRLMTVGNAEPDGPAPQHVIGSGDLLADLRAAHKAFDPKRAKDACLGLEFVFTASRAAFADLSPAARAEKARLLVEVAQLYLEVRFGNEGQVVSLVLHMDEITPHVHAVALPVHWRVDGRAGEREYYRDGNGKQRWRRAASAGKPRKAWMLSADRDLGDRTRMSQHQTAWATTCARAGLDLKRGREGSKDRNRTARQREAELAQATDRASAQAHALGVEREGLVHDRAVVAMVADCQREEADELKRRREALDAERAAWDASIALREAALVSERAKLNEARANMDERSRLLGHDRAVVDMVADCQREEVDELNRQREALDVERAAWDASIAGREAALVSGRAKLDEARADMDERARLIAHDRAVVDMVADCQREDTDELKRRREALDAERAAWDASIAGREVALVADRAKLDEAQAAMDERARAAAKWKRQADARDEAQNARAKRLSESSGRLDARDAALADLLPVVTRAIAMVDPETLPVAERARFFKVARELGVAIERAGKVSPRIAAVAASPRTWQGYQVGG